MDSLKQEVGKVYVATLCQFTVNFCLHFKQREVVQLTRCLHLQCTVPIQNCHRSVCGCRMTSHNAEDCRRFPTFEFPERQHSNMTALYYMSNIGPLLDVSYC